MISPSEQRLISSTLLFSAVADRDDLEQVARIAAWRATKSFRPTDGASPSSYRLSAVRNAVYDEACKFHTVFTLGRHEDRSSIGSIYGSIHVETESHEPVEDVLAHLSAHIDLDCLTDLEETILLDRFLNDRPVKEIMDEFQISTTTFYRTEKALKEWLIDGVQNV